MGVTSRRWLGHRYHFVHLNVPIRPDNVPCVHFRDVDKEDKWHW